MSFAKHLSFVFASHILSVADLACFFFLFFSGTGNVIPKTIVHLYNLSRKALTSGNPKDLEAALAVQDIVSQADWIIVKAVGPISLFLSPSISPPPTSPTKAGLPPPLPLSLSSSPSLSLFRSDSLLASSSLLFIRESPEPSTH